MTVRSAGFSPSQERDCVTALEDRLTPKAFGAALHAITAQLADLREELRAARAELRIVLGRAPLPQLRIIDDHAERIIQLACQQFQISRAAINSPGRTERLVLPRWLAMRVIRDSTGLTLSEIGRRFGKDHTTVIYGLRGLEARLDTEPQIRAAYEQLKEQAKACTTNDDRKAA